MKHWIFGAALAISAALVGCSGGGNAGAETTGDTGGKVAGGAEKGSVNIDGSTTVYPIAQAQGEDFGKSNVGIKVAVTKSGTGSGFKKFIAGEIDICTASRPIEDKEDAQCKEKGIEYVEVPIAYDGVSVIVNKDNAAVADLTLDELKKAWGPDSTVKTWADIRAGLPAEKITFYGPTDNHGTYEYFTEKACGKKNAIRKEYQPNQEYNAIIEAVKSDKNGFAYVGYSYYIENKDSVKVVKINGIEPSPDTIANGTYTPLGRTLFYYVNKKALARPEVQKFLDFALSEEGLKRVTEVDYVSLPAEAYAIVRERLKAQKTGSIFMKPEAGKSTLDILKAAS